MAGNDKISQGPETRGRRQLWDGNALTVGLFCLVIALAVVLVIVLAKPVEEPMPVEAELPGPAADVVIPDPTITLATSSAETSNEALQAELLAEIEALLDRFPESPPALHVAASAYDKIHQTAPAAAAWEKCIQLDPRHVGPRLGLATLMSEKGDDGQAIQLLEQALADGVASAELYYRLAQAHSKVGDVEQAEAVMKDGVAAFPGVGINWLLLGQTQNQLQKFVEAEASLGKANELGIDSSELYFALANACQRQGKSDQAAQYREKFKQVRAEETAGIREKPFQEIYQRALLPIVVGTLASAASIYEQEGDAPKAEQLLLRAQSLDPENRQSLEGLVANFRLQGRWADARLVQQRLVDLQPENTAYLVNLASCNAQLQDWDAAKAALDQARRLSPQNPLPYVGLAQVELQRGNFRQAREYAEQSILREPLPQAYALLVVIYEQLGNQLAAQEAQQTLKRLSSRVSVGQ